MARPLKRTVDYFPHFVNSGKTLLILENEFGNDGYAFWFKLLSLLCKTDGQVYDYNNSSSWRLLLAETHVNEDIAENILKVLAEIDAIDPELYQGKVIWVQNLVDNLGDVYTRRRNGCVPTRPIVTEGHCLTCGVKLTDKRSDAKYCSDTCRVTDSRNRKKGLIPTETPLLSTETPSKEDIANRNLVNVNRKPQTIPDHTKPDHTKKETASLPDWIDKDLWKDFLDMRRKLRKPATGKAQELLIEDLENLKSAGDDPNEVLKQSIKNSWQGLFSLKGGKSGAHWQDSRKLKPRGKYKSPEEHRAAGGS